MHHNMVTIDINRPCTSRIPSVQFDNNRKVKLKIVQNGLPFNLKGMRLMVACVKPDGNEIYNSVKVLDAEKGYAELILTEQINAVIGAVRSNIKIYDATDGVVTTQEFYVNVKPSVNIEGIESTSEYKGLTDAINEVQNFTNRIDETNANLSTKANASEISALSKRIDQIIANNGDTDGNSELIDIRVDGSGYTHTSAGERVRDLETSIITYQKYREIAIEIDGGTNSQNYIKATQHNKGYTHLSCTMGTNNHWMYARVKLYDTIQELIDNPKKFKLLISPEYTGKFCVTFNTTTNWGGGTAKDYQLDVEKDKDMILEIDTTDNAIQSWLKNPETAKGGIYLLLVFKGRGGSSLSVGKTQSLSFGIIDEKGYALSNVSFKSIQSQNAFNADVAKKALTADHSVKSDHANEAEYSILAESSIHAGVKPLTLKNILVAHSGTTITNGNTSYIYTKPVGVSPTFWTGFNLKIEYDNIKDLDAPFSLNYKSLCDTPMTIFRMITRQGDWNPNNSPVDVPFEGQINIYEVIMGLKNEELKQHYINSNVVYFVAGAQASKEHLTGVEVKWEISPMFGQPNAFVQATMLSDSLKANIDAQIKQDSLNVIVENLPEIPLGVKKMPKENFSTTAVSMEVLTASKYRFYKEVKETSESNWLRFYLKIPFKDIKELDTKYTTNLQYAESDVNVKLTDIKILSRKGDWSPSGNPINIKGKEEGVNLYQAIVDAKLLDVYEPLGEVWLVYGYYKGNGADYKDVTLDLTVEPMLQMKDINILASDITAELKQELSNEISDVVMERVGNELELDGGYITCWGDSLTAGGGWTNRLQTLTGMTVYNGGTGGENSRTIMARQGGDVMMVNNIRIPATTEPVTIAMRATDGGITTQLGAKVTPLLQGGSHVNPCYIGGVKGTLKWTGSAHNDMTGTWTFTRAEQGEEVVINRPTAIVTDFDKNRNRPRVMIIFIGQNGGWKDTDDLIRQHRLMLEHAKATNFIVLGLSSGTAAQRADYEEAMTKEFGRRFISLRAYLSQYGLEDANITPTEKDIQMMSQGQTPQSLLSDSVHYNAQCKTVIGDMLYKKLLELNMV